MAKTKVPPKPPLPKGLPLDKLALTWTNGRRTEHIKGADLVRLLEVSEQRLYTDTGPTLREHWTDAYPIASDLDQLSNVVALVAEALPPDQDPNHQAISTLLYVSGALEQMGHRVSGLARRHEQYRMTLKKAGRS